MLDIFTAMAIIGRHPQPVQVVKRLLPEGHQAVVELEALASKHGATLDALSPLWPKILDMIHDGLAFYKRHEKSWAEVGKIIPEAQQMIDEAFPPQPRQFGSPEGELP